MSLLLDALKQAERAKRDAAPDSAASAVPQTPGAPTTEAPGDSSDSLGAHSNETADSLNAAEPVWEAETPDPTPDTTADATETSTPQGPPQGQPTTPAESETGVDPTGPPLTTMPPGQDQSAPDPAQEAEPTQVLPTTPAADETLEITLGEVTLDGQPDSASLAADFAAELAADEQAAESDPPAQEANPPEPVATSVEAQPPLSLAPEAGEASPSPGTDPAALQSALNTLAAGRAKRRRRTWLTTASLSLLLLLMLAIGLWIYWRHPVAGPPQAARPFAPYPLLAEAAEATPTPPAPAPAGNAPGAAATGPNGVGLPPPPDPRPAEPEPLQATPATPLETAQSTAAVPAPQPGLRPDQSPASGITFTRRARSANPAQRQLSAGQRALAAGDLAAASNQFQALLARAPGHIGALLGLASVALLQGDAASAAALYRRVLAIDPRQATAQAGLINTLGSADPGTGISQLKQLLATQPNNAYLHFTLGSLYARTGDWSGAQHHFFAASAADGGNPVYAFNLAVALEHLGKQRLALTHYQRALARVTPPFAGLIDRATLNARIAALQREHP